MVKLQVCKVVTMKNYITHTHTVHSARIYNLPYTNTAPQVVFSSTMECICAGSHHCWNYTDVILTQKYKHMTYHIQNNKPQMGHSMSSERMKKPDHLRFYSYLVDLKYHGR
jgi:hypothetical protein